MKQMKAFFFLLWLRLKIRLLDMRALISEVTIHFFGNFTAFLGYFLIVDRFHMIGDFSQTQATLLYGIVSFGFGTAKFIYSGLDSLLSNIYSGNILVYTTKPFSPLKRIGLENLRYAKIGKILEAFIVLIIAYCTGCKVSLFILFLLLISSLLFYSAVFMFYYSFIFLFPYYPTKSFEMFTQLVSGINRYPLVIFGTKFLKFFTVFFPIAFVHYLPLKQIFNGKPFSLSLLFSIIVSAMLFFITKLLSFPKLIAHFSCFPFILIYMRNCQALSYSLFPRLST